jgi:hypothetical protein
MTALGELEQDFQSFVLAGAPRIERGIVGTARVAAARRLAIYADAYRARLAEALESNYPMLAKLLGAERFGDLAGTYIDRYRSDHFSIRWYGDRLSALLTADSLYRGERLLAELARFEWSMALAFDAADAPALKAAALESLAPDDWPQLSFKFHPSVQLLALDTGAPVVWKALNQDQTPPQEFLTPSAAGSEETKDRLPNWMIWRRGIETFFRSLNTTESRALQTAMRGATFAAICEALAEEVGEENAAQEAAQLLARWLQDELLIVVDSKRRGYGE